MSRKVVDEYGTYWFNEQDQYHKEDGPAIEYFNGDKFWYLNDKLHRENGPACEYANGTKEWWINGVEYSEKVYKWRILI